jgi:hypothetical protein
MILPKGMENRSAGNQNNSNSSSNSNGMKNRGQLAECWAGSGLWAGIWIVTFGILASGILIR